MSHHKDIFLGDKKIGHVRIRNDGIVLSVWIDTSVQSMLFIPDNQKTFLLTLPGEEE